MSRPTNNMSEELFKVDGKTSVGETLPLALQHVVAMIVGDRKSTRLNSSHPK